MPEKLRTWILCKFCSRVFQGREGFSQLRRHEVTHIDKTTTSFTHESESNSGQSQGNSFLLRRENQVVNLKELKIPLKRMTLSEAQIIIDSNLYVDLSNTSSACTRKSGRVRNPSQLAVSTDKLSDSESEWSDENDEAESDLLDAESETGLPIPNRKSQTSKNKTNRKSRLKGVVENFYQCDYCGKSYRSSQGREFIFHVRQHTGDRPYVCNHPGCSSKFTRSDGLHKHKLIHLDIKPFVCPHCSRGFSDGSGFRRHVRNIHNTKNRPWYQCQSCDKKFGDRTKLRTHERIHTGEKPYSCKFCEMKFHSTSLKHSHQIRHNETMGPIPNRQRVRAKNLIRNFSCEKCGSKFVKKWSLLYHKCHGIFKPQGIIEHEIPFEEEITSRIDTDPFSEIPEKDMVESETTGALPNKSTGGGFIYVNLSDIVKEANVDTIENIFQARAISSITQQAGSQANEVLTTGTETVPVSVIPISIKSQPDFSLVPSSTAKQENIKQENFPIISAIQINTETFVKGEISMEISDMFSSNDLPIAIPHATIADLLTQEVKTFRFNEAVQTNEPCGNTDSNNRTRTRPAQAKTKLNTDIEIKFGTNIYKSKYSRIIGNPPCPLCGKVFPKRHNLLAHIKRHGAVRTFKCDFPLCGKAFTNPYNLETHSKCHTVESPYKCNECGKFYRQKHGLTNHMRTHKGMSSYPHGCSYCSVKFNTSGKKKLHELRHHIKEKKFKCGYCEKVFLLKDHLILHERIHTGEKPFKCSFCNKGFARPYGKTRHELIHINEFGN